MDEALWEALGSEGQQGREVPTCTEHVLVGELNSNPSCTQPSLGVIGGPYVMGSDSDGMGAKGAHTLQRPDIGQKAWGGFSLCT